MKKYLILGFFLAVGSTILKDSFVAFIFNDQQYSIPTVYLFLIFTIFFISGFLLAYEWQAIKIVFKNWKIYSLKRDLTSIQKNVDDYRALTSYLKSKKNPLLTLPEINTLQRQSNHALSELLDNIKNNLDLQNFDQAFKSYAQLPKKMSSAIKHIIYFDILKSKLMSLDSANAIIYLQNHDEWIWNYDEFINEGVHLFQKWPRNEFSVFVTRIDPVKLTTESLSLIEKISFEDSIFWLNLFYEKKWHLFCHHNPGLAFLLLKMNLKNGNKLQALELIETLPFSLAKVAIKAYVASKLSLDNQSSLD